nr:MAG: replication associated protein [Cressdnaviricota sp.]
MAIPRIDFKALNLKLKEENIIKELKIPKTKKEKILEPENCKSKASNYCFTIFDDKIPKYYDGCWNVFDYTEWNSLKKYSHLSYIIAGQERTPSTDRPHLQGYMQLDNSYSIKAIKKECNTTCKLIECTGTAEENIQYCKGYKNGKFKNGTCENVIEEQGTLKNQGKRTDLIQLQNDLNAGVSLSKISEDHFAAFLRYKPSILSYQQLHPLKRTWKTEVYVHWGISESGKTTDATNYMGIDKTFVFSPGNNVWWDGYDNQKHEVVVLDEYSSKKRLNIENLKQLLDEYPINVEVKGGWVPFLAKRIYITSNEDPALWYHDKGLNLNDIEALYSRFSVVKYYKYKVPKHLSKRKTIYEEQQPFEEQSTYMQNGTPECTSSFLLAQSGTPMESTNLFEK